MPKRATAATAIIVALTFSACGGESESADTTSPSPATEAAPVTTEPDTEPSTTEATATEPAPTTTATTTTTEPATTTTEPSVKDKVRAAALAAYDSYWACLRVPGNCDIAARNLPGSDAFNAFTLTVDGLIDGGYYVGEEDVGYIVIEEIEIKDDHTAVTSCWWSTGVLYFLPDIEGAPATVQNDGEESGRQIDQYVQDPDDGLWKIRRSDILTNADGENECPPEQ